MRFLCVLLVGAALAGCADHKYTSLPEPEGPWLPSYATRIPSMDNNLVPSPVAAGSVR